VANFDVPLVHYRSWAPGAFLAGALCRDDSARELTYERKRVTCKTCLERLAPAEVTP
jgi:hypothetical protein